MKALDAEMAKCKQELRYLGAVPIVDPNAKRLIISTGDITDVDGFCALAEYAKSGADVLFVMNYPGYLGCRPDETCNECAEGLGFTYGVNEFLTMTQPPEGDTKYVAYQQILTGYSKNVKSILTDLAFAMSKSAWGSKQDGKGSLYFCIGGINKINPFHASQAKNEILVYIDTAITMKNLSELQEKDVVSVSNEMPFNLHELLKKYTDIYIDFNGSMAFFDEEWNQLISDSARSGKVKGVFVAGGVYASEEPKTMASINGVLNRFSCCTMNQLYHPLRTSNFLTLMNELNINMYFVANNEVDGLVSSQRCIDCLKANQIQNASLEALCLQYYNSQYNPQKKLFDFYVAFSLCKFLSNEKDFGQFTAAKSLHFNSTYGVALIGKARERWPSTYLAYTSNAQILIKNCENQCKDIATPLKQKEFAEMKAASFKKELAKLSEITCSSCKIFILQFNPLEPNLIPTLKSHKRARKALTEDVVYMKKPDSLESILWFQHGFSSINGAAEKLMNKKCVIRHSNGTPIIGNPPQDPDSVKYMESIEYEHGETLTNRANDVKAFTEWNEWYNSNVKQTVEYKFNILKNTICSWKIMTEWYRDLDPVFMIKKNEKLPDGSSTDQYGIMIQSYDFFGTNQGFIKFQAFVVNKIAYDNGRSIGAASSPGITFLRSAAVAMLPVITSDENPDKKYTLLTIQARVPAGIAQFKEIPAGMMDTGNNFGGTVAKEMKEETGLVIHTDKMVCLSDKVTPRLKGMYPSVGGCSEYIRLFSWRYHFTKDEFRIFKSKIDTETHGEKEEGEFIQLCLVELDQLHLHAPDAKALSALALYNIYLKQLENNGEKETVHRA